MTLNRNLHVLKSCLTISGLLLFLSALYSCNGTKQCAAPELALPETYNPSSGIDTASVADMEWWDFYGDSLLCSLINRALENNKDILIAASRVQEMRALYGASSAALLPQLSGGAYANNESNNYSGNGNVNDPEIGLKVTLSWEADLWRRLSWAKRKSAAAYQASVYDLQAMRMTLVSEVASAYFTLLALDSELDIVRRTLVTRKEGLQQAKLRYEGGLTSEMVYRQAEVEYTTTASLLPALEERVALTESGLRLLLGEYATAPVERPKIILSEVVMSDPSTGVPSSLLQRRPDLRAAEAELRMAMADVGISWADRFPKFTINITGGLENNRLSDFLRSPFSFVAGNLTSPIFDFGKRKRQYEASLARYDQARLTYEKQVMQAFREVNDALTQYNAARQSAQMKTSLRDAAMNYVELARLQYIGGTSLYIDVLDAQRRYFDAQIALSNAVRNEYLALVNLYKSLGGGWSRDGR